MKYLIPLLSVSLFSLATVTGQNTGTKNQPDTLMPVSDWQSYPIPTVASSQQYTGNDPWAVCLKDGNVYASAKQRTVVPKILPFKHLTHQDSLDNKPGKITIFPVQNGFLAGIGRGQTDGGLYWLSPDREKKELIAAGNVVQLKRAGNKIYMLQTDSLRSGVKAVMYQNNKWTASEITSLKSAPVCMEFDSKGNIILMTLTGLVKITPNLTPESLDTIPAQILSPTSLVIKDDIVFVGMKKGVLRYNLQTHQQELLIPNRQPSMSKP